MRRWSRVHTGAATFLASSAVESVATAASPPLGRSDSAKGGGWTSYRSRKASSAKTLGASEMHMSVSTRRMARGDGGESAGRGGRDDCRHNRVGIGKHWRPPASRSLPPSQQPVADVFFGLTGIWKGDEAKLFDDLRRAYDVS